MPFRKSVEGHLYRGTYEKFERRGNMRKAIVLIFLMMLCSCAYGAASGDAYVRQDVFDAKMEAFMAEIRLMNEQLLVKFVL